MSQPTHLSRRQFLQASGLTLGSLVSATAALPPSPSRRRIIGFSKPFADFTPEETADLVADIGWDGVECPVREKATHIKPERIEEDLPRMVEALRKNGKEVTIVTTDILRVDSSAEKILRTIARLGIKRYRLGFAHYPKDQPISATLRECASAFKDLAAINRELGLQGGYQNHSGADYVGGPLWDLWHMMREIDPGALGVCFDIGQAMIEGGLSWPVQVRLTQPQWVAIYIKDFSWNKDPVKGWLPRWCALGEGRVSKEYFTELNPSDSECPISQHHEHLKVGMPRGELRAALKKDYAQLRSWLA